MPRTDAEMSDELIKLEAKCQTLIEDCRNGLGKEDMYTITEWFRIMRFRDYPRTITKAEYENLGVEIKKISLPMTWVCQHFKIERGSQLLESQCYDVIHRPQTYWDMYKKTIQLPDDVLTSWEKPQVLPAAPVPAPEPAAPAPQAEPEPMPMG